MSCNDVNPISQVVIPNIFIASPTHDLLPYILIFLILNSNTSDRTKVKNICKIRSTRAGEMPLRLRMLVILKEGLSLFPSTYKRDPMTYTDLHG